MENNVQTVDVKHIFIDIANYTFKRSVEAQTDLISVLNNIVLESIIENKIIEDDRIFIPTGDGMCISLINILSPYDIHIKIALDILRKLGLYNDSQVDKMRKFNIRIGINENIDNLIIDINGNRNISGSGINYASRIESLCDSNQIIVGNSVYDKLVQREKYMNSFKNFTTEVKHGLSLNVHQYINNKVDYLNNEIPSKFKPLQFEVKVFKLTKIQAFYIANCLKYEELISKNIKAGQADYSLQVLLFQLSEDEIAKARVTKKDPNPRKKVKRTFQEHFDYIQSVDFWIICDLNSYNERKHLSSIMFCFSETYLFISEAGKAQLKKDFPYLHE